VAFTWTNSIKAYFGSGGSLLSDQGAGGLKALLTEIRTNLDTLDTNADATEVRLARVEGIVADEGLTSTTAP